jgi:pimeloyl-ACP methyl ester carboxylesterase
MSFFGLFKSYDDVWKSVIVPPRLDYAMSDFGPSEFSLKGQFYRRKDMTLKNRRGLNVEGSYFELRDGGSANNPCLLYLHANGCNRLEGLQYLDFVLSNDMSLMCFDFVGCGKSGGEYCTLGWNERDDVECVLNYLTNTAKVSKVVLWGRSMGAVTALMYAGNDPRISAIIVDSAFSSFKHLVKDLAKSKASIPGFLASGAYNLLKGTIKEKVKLDIDNLKPIKYAENLKIPALFGHAQDDALVSPQHTREIYRKYGGPKQMVIFEGDHNSARPINFILTIKEFLKKHVFESKLKQPTMGVKTGNSKSLERIPDLNSEMLLKLKSSQTLKRSAQIAAHGGYTDPFREERARTPERSRTPERERVNTIENRPSVLNERDTVDPYKNYNADPRYQYNSSKFDYVTNENIPNKPLMSTPRHFDNKKTFKDIASTTQQFSYPPSYQGSEPIFERSNSFASTTRVMESHMEPRGSHVSMRNFQPSSQEIRTSQDLRKNFHNSPSMTSTLTESVSHTNIRKSQLLNQSNIRYLSEEPKALNRSKSPVDLQQQHLGSTSSEERISVRYRDNYSSPDQSFISSTKSEVRRPQTSDSRSSQMFSHPNANAVRVISPDGTTSYIQAHPTSSGNTTLKSNQLLSSASRNIDSRAPRFAMNQGSMPVIRELPVRNHPNGTRDHANPVAFNYPHPLKSTGMSPEASPGLKGKRERESVPYRYVEQTKTTQNSFGDSSYMTESSPVRTIRAISTQDSSYVARYSNLNDGYVKSPPQQVYRQASPQRQTRSPDYNYISSPKPQTQSVQVISSDSYQQQSRGIQQQPSYYAPSQIQTYSPPPPQQTISPSQQQVVKVRIQVKAPSEEFVIHQPVATANTPKTPNAKFYFPSENVRYTTVTSNEPYTYVKSSSPNMGFPTTSNTVYSEAPSVNYGQMPTNYSYPTTTIASNDQNYVRRLDYNDLKSNSGGERKIVYSDGRYGGSAERSIAAYPESYTTIPQSQTTYTYQYA